MTDDRTLTESTVSAPIEAPLDQIDIAGWLFSMTDAEYQRCAPGSHVAAGTSRTDDGELMSINVEHIGDALVVEHYVAEVAEAQRCLLVSESDSISPAGSTTVEVTWELTAGAGEGGRVELHNRVRVRATDELLAVLERNGIPFEQAAASRHEAALAHNQLETPLFAKSIERVALAAANA